MPSRWGKHRPCALTEVRHNQYPLRSRCHLSANEHYLLDHSKWFSLQRRTVGSLWMMQSWYVSWKVMRFHVTLSYLTDHGCIKVNWFAGSAARLPEISKGPGVTAWKLEGLKWENIIITCLTMSQCFLLLFLIASLFLPLENARYDLMWPLVSYVCKHWLCVEKNAKQARTSQYSSFHLQRYHTFNGLFLQCMHVILSRSITYQVRASDASNVIQFLARRKLIHSCESQLWRNWYIFNAHLMLLLKLWVFITCINLSLDFAGSKMAFSAPEKSMTGLGHLWIQITSESKLRGFVWRGKRSPEMLHPHIFQFTQFWAYSEVIDHSGSQVTFNGCNKARRLHLTRWNHWRCRYLIQVG